MVNGWLQDIQGALFPPTCILCGDRGQPPALDLCPGCADDLPRNRHPCRQCATPLDSNTHEVCPDCMTRGRPFARSVAPYVYAYPLDHLVRTFKYDGVLAYGRVLGTLLAGHLAHAGEPLPELLLPVPLHVSRHRERGFNQTIELARHVGSLLDVRMDPWLCERVRATGDQTELSARQRRKNVRRAFALPRRLRATHVALLDDVMTTGSTVAEMATQLVRGGVKRVEVWAVARATL